MSGSERFVVDTNVLFMAAYNPNGKAGKIIKKALEGKIELFSTDSVKEEISRVLKRELNFSDSEAELFIDELPVKWIDRESYLEFIKKTVVKHKADKPVEALALVLNCGVISADYHFKNRVDVNSLVED